MLVDFGSQDRLLACQSPNSTVRTYRPGHGIAAGSFRTLYNAHVSPNQCSSQVSLDAHLLSFNEAL